MNLYQYNLEDNKNTDKLTMIYLKKYLSDINNVVELYSITDKFYNKGISGIDLMNYIITNYSNNIEKYKLLIVIQKIKKEFRSEKLIIMFILNLMFFRSDSDLENILSM